MKRSMLIFFYSTMEDNNPLFGRGQGLVYGIFFDSLGIGEGNK